ncbi:hypothetical protein HYH03_012459 [Edaphochlamys debaryana]|uniref:VASt domain-containing protein n=1 Tax=Edaphochlamys debaryana TaxID=47281 RepID=A0A835XVC3_9CHLO|nr:hypothetical protein HYH03_012459 [Edaphochlamys debaryana]|eukprot:KAG2489021.1 hypothetical protein HYH03_012459 [Edaphochlamys debaryana]
MLKLPVLKGLGGASVTSSAGGGPPPQETSASGVDPPPPPSLDPGRTSLTLSPEDGGTIDDGGSSVAAATSSTPVPIFYAGVMLRGHKGDLARFFELPPTESLRGDFHCAMRKRVLLQGRMYVFDHYVCFYSAVFGFAKKRRIPMRTIKAVKKKTHLGFPNSLEIEADERKDFYTSFLSREEAYQLIMRLVPEAKQLADNGEDSVVMRRSTDTGTGAVRDMGSSPNAGGRGEGGRGGAGRGGADRSLVTRNSGSMVDEGEEDEEDTGVWTVEPRSAPPVAPGSRHVLHSTLAGSPRDFFETVLADSAPFFEDFLDGQGNRRINLTAWKRHPQLGHVRDLHFTAPIKGAFGNWGVSHTACYQSHRFCLYSEDHIVFESSQTMTDIPYGDCFTVDQRWDVRRDPHAEPDKPQITFDLHVRVPFTSRCLFKGVIESGSFKQVQETFAQFVEQLRPVMQDRFTSRNTLTLRGPTDGGAGPGVGLGAGPAGASAGPPPRLGSTGRVGTMGTIASMGRGGPSGPSLASMRAPTMARVASTHAPGGFDAGEPPPLGDTGSGGLGGGGGPGGGGGGGEPGVGRLLVSLGGRLVDGARGLLEAGIDVVLNLTQCQCTPQMRFLVAVVILMFLANLAFLLLSAWPGPIAAGPSAATSGAAGPTSPAAGAPGPGVLGGGSLPGVGFGSASGSGLGGGGLGANIEVLQALLNSATAGGGGADAGSGSGAGGHESGSGPGSGSAAYFVQRLLVLHQELALLQGRMELVGREVGAVVGHLASSGLLKAAAEGVAAAAAVGETVAGAVVAAATAGAEL